MAPKEKTSLKLIFDTKDSPGPFEKIATITTSAPSIEELEVTMSGKVREAPAAKIRVTPRKIELGPVTTGSVHKKELAILNEGSLPLEIRKIYGKETSAVYFDAEKEGEMSIKPGETKKIEIAITPGTRGTQVQELIIIESNGKNATKGGYVIMVRYRGS
ncbi:MAG TPA: hypothetical protein VGJ94_10845 [Syntrophorhabdaceae bacterium]